MPEESEAQPKGWHTVGSKGGHRSEWRLEVVGAVKGGGGEGIAHERDVSGGVIQMDCCHIDVCHGDARLSDDGENRTRRAIWIVEGLVIDDYSWSVGRNGRHLWEWTLGG